MGEELPLARSEEAGQPMLLAVTGSGELITTSCNRNKRTKDSSPSKARKRRETKDTETESQSGSKTEGANASSSEKARRGRDYKNRKPDRGDEGAHKRVRRSAQELGIVYPGSYCDEFELVPHYWIETERVHGGSLLRCKHCFIHIWLPLYFTDAEHLSKLIKVFGTEEGYQIYLNKNRAAKVLLAKLQDLGRLETEMADKREFGRVADKVLSDREYDRKEG